MASEVRVCCPRSQVKKVFLKIKDVESNYIPTFNHLNAPYKLDENILLDVSSSFLMGIFTIILS